eukprot:5533377-Lingulodinium_polyedra.AAC.1
MPKYPTTSCQKSLLDIDKLLPRLCINTWQPSGINANNAMHRRPHGAPLAVNVATKLQTPRPAVTTASATWP